MCINRPTALLCTAIAIAALIAPANAEIITISNLPIEGSQITTPIPDAGTGVATVTIDTETLFITIEGSYSNMLGTVLAAHLHGPAAIGVDSPLIITRIDNTGGTDGTLSLSRSLTQRHIDFMLDSLTYINVHTDAHTDGEIRGQIVVPAPATGIAGALALLLSTRRRR